MQRFKNEPRRTFASLAAMVMLIAGSVGCVSWEHHIRKHSLLAKVAKKNQGRYYHCPHCGQIIMQEGSRCPGCYKMPAYHGYQATCWRTFPEGWGCLPETVANNPAFFQPGMLESAIPSEAYQPVEAVQVEESNDEVSDDVAATDEDSDGPNEEDAAEMDVEEIAPPIPDTEPNNSEVKISRLPGTTLATETTAPLSQPTEPIAPVKPAAKPAVDQQVTKPETENLQPVKEIAKAKKVGTPKPTSVSVQRTIMKTPAPAVPAVAKSVASKVAPVPVQQTAKKPTTTSVLNKHPVVTKKPAPKVSEETVQRIAKKPTATPELNKRPVATKQVAATPAPVAVKVQRPVVAKEPIVATSEPTKSTAQQPQSTRRPFHSVSRIPVPPARVVFEPSEERPALIRVHRGVIDVNQKPKAVQSDKANSEMVKQPISPRDELGPIPVRKVRLTGLESPSSTKGNLKTVSDQTITKIKKSVAPRSPSSNMLHPAPVRRVKLSELPFTIKN
ncbi:MAG: hypothetical protein AB8B91_03775 [Rubripirellula sp.]